jgi:hypothetical protein
MDSQRSWQGLDLRCYRRSRCLLIFVFLVFLALPLSATTYYVDNCVNTGSDSYDGTEQTHTTGSTGPWLTIAHVNAQTFSAGDSVLFQSSCVWREQLTVPSSGSSGNPFTFGEYGTGAAPIISGSNLETSWTTETTIYYTSVATQPNQVFRNGQRLTLSSSKTALATGDWWWDSANLRVYVYDNPSGHTIEASQRNYAVNTNNQSYLTIQGIEADKAQFYGIYANGGPGTGILIQNDVAQYNFVDGIRDDSTLNLTISLSTAAYNAGNGIEVYGSPAYPTNNVLVDRCTSHDNNPVVANQGTWYAGIWVGGSGAGANNITIQSSLVYDNGLGQSVASSNGAGIHVDTAGSNIIVQWNTFYNNNMDGIDIESTAGVSVLYNLSYGNGAVGGRGGIYLAEYTATGGEVVYNNTSYGNVAYGIRLNGAGAAGSCIDTTVENNIAVASTSGTNFSATGGCQNDGTDGYGNVYAYNDFGPATAKFITWGASHYSTYASWEAATGNCGTAGCSHSIQTAPTFINAAANNFTLASGSSAIDVGANLGSTYQMGLAPSSSWPASVSTLNQNSYGSGWEIGAFVFVQPISPAPPTSLSVTVH